MGCRVTRGGIQNWKDSGLKINVTKGNNGMLRIGVMGRCQKVPKFNFQSQYSLLKIIGIFRFFIDEYRFRSTFIVRDHSSITSSKRHGWVGSENGIF